MEKGTFAEFSKFGIDFEDIILWEETEEAEPSPGPGTLTLISESSVQSQPSSRPSLKDAAPEDQDVSFSSCNMPWSIYSWWTGGHSVCSVHNIFIYPKVDPKVPKVLFHGINRVRRAWREQACLGFPFGCRIENLMEIRSGCTAMTFWVHVAHTDMRTLQFTIAISCSLWWPPASLLHLEA